MGDGLWRRGGRGGEGKAGCERAFRLRMTALTRREREREGGGGRERERGGEGWGGGEGG